MSVPSIGQNEIKRDLDDTNFSQHQASSSPSQYRYTASTIEPADAPYLMPSGDYFSNSHWNVDD